MYIILEHFNYRKESSLKIVGSHTSLEDAQSAALNLSLTMAEERGESVSQGEPDDNYLFVKSYVCCWKVGDGYQNYVYYVVPS
jgi:hypothetical protein